jgi:hypothetical protein
MAIVCPTVFGESLDPQSVNISGKAGAQITHLPLGDDSPPLLGEIMQYAFNLTRFTWLCVTSHSQPLINAKYKFQVTNYLQTMFKTITNEPIWIIILITSWLTLNIAPFHSRSNEHH